MIKLIDKYFWPVVFVLWIVSTIIIAWCQLETIRTVNGEAFVPTAIMLSIALINEIKNAIMNTWGDFFDDK